MSEVPGATKNENATKHTVRLAVKPFGGTRGHPKTGTVLKLLCSCGRNVETGDNYGSIPLNEVETHLRRSLREMHGERA